MKRILLLVLCLALFACTEEPKPGKIVSIELTEEDLTILVGEFGSTIAYVEKDNPANCDSTVEWSSSNESIAVAHANGDECLIEGISPGEAIITANTPEGLSATCKVTVVAKVIPVTGISLSKVWLEILENRTETLTAFLKPSDATNTKVTWSSTDESIATVNDGTVRGIKPGRAKIKAETEDGGFVAECDVTVTKDYQSQSKGPVTLKLGNVTASTVTFFGTLDVDQLGDYDMADGGVGFIYTTTDKTLNVSNAKKVKITTVGSNNEFSFTYTGLPYDTRYHYTVFLYKNGICQYGSTQYFKTEDVNINVDEVTTGTSSATFKGTTSLLWGDRSAINVGIQYSKYDSFSSTTTINLSDSTETFEYKREGLAYATKYYYRTYIKQNSSYKYGNAQEFTTQPISVSIGVDNLTQTTATFSGNIDLAGGEGISVGVRYWPVSGGDTIKKSFSDIDENGNYSITVKDLKHGTQYRYSYYTYQNGSYIYGDTQEFTTEAIPVTISADEITQTTASFKGKAELSEPDAVEIGVRYSTKSTDFSSSSLSSSATEVSFKDALDGEGNFNSKETGLLHGTKYYYAYYIKQAGKYTFGEVREFSTQMVEPRVTIDAITQTTATFSGHVEFSENDAQIEVGILYVLNKVNNLNVSTADAYRHPFAINSNGDFVSTITNLHNEALHSYRLYTCQNGVYNYGEIENFTTANIPINLIIDNITQTCATFSGEAKFTEPNADIEIGIEFQPGNISDLNIGENSYRRILNFDSEGEFLCDVKNLKYETSYVYRYYIYQKGRYIYGPTGTFTTHQIPVSAYVSETTIEKTIIKGNVKFSEPDNGIEIGILYTDGFNYGFDMSVAEYIGHKTIYLDAEGNFSVYLYDLKIQTNYAFRYYIKQHNSYKYGEIMNFTTPNEPENIIDLSSSASANCYIVSSPGKYKIRTVMGNSAYSVPAESVGILWKSYGSTELPGSQDLLSIIGLSSSHILFNVPDDYKEGNALIAVRDRQNNIRWSWHIWLTDQPEEHVYPERTGVFMDRNLGATTAIPGDYGALGLLYQWGRKDPFLGSASITKAVEPASTGMFTTVNYSESTGVDFTIENPKTFIKGWQPANYDLWKSNKSIYDPCPPGWCILGDSSHTGWEPLFESNHNMDNYVYTSKLAMNLCNYWDVNYNVWYPFSGYRNNDGELYYVGESATYWSCRFTKYGCYALNISYYGTAEPSANVNRGAASVRCQKE